MTNPVVQKMVENIETFKRLIQSKAGERSERLLQLVDAVEDRLIEAPASSRTEYQGCFAGGLVEHSLNVVRLMSDLNKTYSANINSQSIVLTGLFHDIGKVGAIGGEPYYLEKESDWHRRQGILYEVNQKLSGVPISLRSLDLLQAFQANLTSDEFLAIASIKDRPRGEESLPNPGETILSIVLQQAVRMACFRGHGVTSLTL